MRNTAILVTGSTGLIGNALTYSLRAASDKYGLNLNILAHGRDAAKGKLLSKNCGVEFICGDIRKTFRDLYAFNKLEYIIHCSSITKSSDMAYIPVDVIATAVEGARNILELSKDCCVRSVVYLSSMEIYGKISSEEVTESFLGYLDLSNPRSCYPESKRLCENLCCCYLYQYAVPVKIARLSQTFGAGSSKEDTRVFAQFARSALEGENIVLHTEGQSVGNYCYLADTIKGLILLLLKGKDGEAYNIVNPASSVTIREMADIVANKICGGEISVVVDIPDNITKYGYAPDTCMKLKADKIKALGWQPTYGLIDMYKRMMADWHEMH